VIKIEGNSFSMPYCCNLHTVRVHEGHPSQVVKTVGKPSFVLSYHVAKTSIKPAPKLIFLFLSSAPQVKLQAFVLFSMTGLCQSRADRNARSSQCPSPLGATRIFHLICGTCRAGSSYIHTSLCTHRLGIISSGESTRSNPNLLGLGSRGFILQT
jgi:hypothetical protein